MARDRNRRGEQGRIELLVNSISDYAIFMLDLGGHVATWNAGARRFKGYEPDEIIGRHFSCFLTEEDREAGYAEVALRTAAAEGHFEAEGWRVRKDGTRFWANAIIDAVRDEQGELIGFAKITRDMTARREAEQKLFESEQRFRLLVQGVRDYAIFMLDLDGNVVNWNTGAKAIKGYGAEEVLGRHFSIFYPPADREAGVPAHALATALSEGKYEAESVRLRKDGSEFWAHVVIDPIYDDEGRHIGFAKITRDVTERREAQQELEEAHQSLFQAQKLQALGELTGGVAHDFNNLITVIRGSAELLQSSTLGEEKKRRYLDAIVETADRAAALTGQLLAFSRRQALTPEVVDLNARLRTFAQVVARTLGGRIDVRLDLAGDLWAAEVDATQLETALLNAAINARDAMPDGGTLTIATANASTTDGARVVVSITDTGAGMPPEVADRAFEPFFTTKPTGKGTGLGLSQIHGFAAQSGGRAEIESVPGEGTTIRILLPRSMKTADEGRQARTEVSGGQGRHVLLVEDNDPVREFAESLLQDLNFRVTSAGSSEEALAFLDEQEVDIVFTDIVMPGSSGVELGRTVRARLPHVPVILASGYGDEMVGEAAAEFTLLRKPYGADSLSRALAAALAKQDAKAEPAGLA